MDIFALIAEDKIKTAIKKGEMDHLLGKGKPLQLGDLSAIPEDLRMGYHLLKNAGFLNEESKLGQDILKISDLVNYCADEEERMKLLKELNEKRARFEKIMEERKLTKSKAYKQYRDQLRDKI